MKDVLDSRKSEDVELEFFSDDQLLPLIITPKKEGLNLIAWGESNKEYIKELLTEFGGILFRGFGVSSSNDFEAFIDKVSSSALTYKERSSPRSSVGGNIYTSTDHPNDKVIFMHSEQSYNLTFPLRIFFYCETPAKVGGATPIGDARKIYARIPVEIREKFLQKQYRYSRCFWPMMGITWQTAFQTSDRPSVEQYCQENDIEFEWLDGDALRAHQTRPMVAQHPISNQKCWFNHCTFFNFSTLDTQAQELLSSCFSETEYPNNTFYGDGESIEPEVMEVLRNAYEAEKVEFAWEKGDVLMLDNMLTTHGRASFEGDRSILVGMSEPCAWSDVESM